MIDYITILSALSLLVFVSIFTGAVVWVLKLDSDYIHSMADLPIQSAEPPTTAGENDHA